MHLRFAPLHATLVFIVALLGVSCSSTEEGSPLGEIDVTRPECENLNPAHCTLPFPSSRYLAEDASTVSGWRVDFPLEAMPTNQYDEPVSSLSPWNAYDGYSPLTAAMTLYEGELDASLLVDQEHIADSLLSSSTTIWLDAETGERVAHWAELDGWPETPADRASLYIRPARRLEPSHRYIVATRGLQRIDGTPVEPSAYFQALRDGIPTDRDELEARREAFEDLFAILEAAGIARGELIEAWEFRTASDESLSAETLALRDASLVEAGDQGIGCTVLTVDDDVNAEVWRRVRGTFTVPLYMTHQYEGSKAQRGADGSIEQNGYAEAPFEVDIPYSVRDAVLAGDGPQPGLMYGHGLLGSARQVGSGGTRVALQRLGMVGFGTDYWGLSEGDEGHFVTSIVTQWGNFDDLAERLMQGTVNSVVLARSFRGVCADLPELTVDGGAGPLPVLAKDETYYYGISQGGIMGATVAAMTPDIERFVLQVGAVGYSHMMRRSRDFQTFELIFSLWYPDPVDRHFLITSTQAAWDRTDPSTYVQHLLAGTLPGTPAKKICYQTSRFDTEVHNAMSDVAARTMGIPFFEQSVYEPFDAPNPTMGPSDSGYIIYHLHDVEPFAPGAQPPPQDNNAHGDLRFMEPVLQQMETFLRPGGQVESFCPAGSCELTNTRL